ncbi:MAG TPA: hypothetical protein VGL40_02325 [Bacillota bacterium]|jgi:hypothetical protein
MPGADNRKNAPDKGLTWTINAARRLWRQFARRRGHRPAALTAGVALVAAVGLLTVAVRLVGPPLLKRGLPAGNVLIAPTTPNAQKAAQAAARVRGARPVVVVSIGNTIVVGLDPKATPAASIPRVVEGVRRALGPFPRDEGAINDPANPSIAQVYATTDAAAVQGLTSLAQHLNGGAPLASLIGDLIPLLRTAAGAP